MALSGLEVGFLLDRQWHLLRNEMESSKQPALLALTGVLAQCDVPYAIIGGLALQVHQAEPRTTLDIDLAVSSLDQIPRAALEAAGFVLTGRFAHSENWLGPDNVPVQFSGDPALGPAIERSIIVSLGTARLRVITPVDLVHEKLRAGSDPARRRSKRLQDLADVQSLLEQDPDLNAELTESERALLGSLPA